MSEIDWEIRPYEDSDAAAVDALLRAAFPSDAEAKLVQMLREQGDAEVEFLADAEGEIIGHVMLSAMQSPEQCLGLAPVATVEAVRKQGVAGSLIESARAMASANDWRGVFVLGDLSYYERFGFEADAAAPFETAYPKEHFGFALLDEDEPVAPAKADYAQAFSAL